MRLNDPLPSEVELDGKTYPINLAFDNVLDVFDVMTNKELSELDKVEMAITFLFEEKKPPIEKWIPLWQKTYEELIMTDSNKPQVDLKGNIIPPKPGRKRFIDLKQDAPYIYASFRFAGIDLFKEQGVLQWSQFQALLEGLPEESIIQRIIKIRQWEPSKGDSNEYREEMRKLQREYQLEDDYEGGEDDE